MRSALQQSVAILLEHDEESESSRRFVDLAISLRLCEVDPKTRAWRTETDEELIEVGGRWDRRLKKWIGEAKRIRVIRVHRGQEESARWLAEWFRRRAAGPRGPQWEDFRRVWSLMLLGGRRGGKTHLACVALCMFVVMTPTSRVWAISPTQEETDELEAAVRMMLPRRYYRFRGGGAGKPLQFRLPHGGRLFCLSGNKPRSLKRGRVDFCLYNEAQNMYRAGWIQLRGAIADRGGLVVMACNPPDAEIGRWIETVHEQARAKTNLVQLYELSAKRNPFVEYQALADMEADVNDELTFRREVLGEFVPIGDVVFHGWSDAESVREVPAHYIDVTPEFTEEHLGRRFGYVVGMDFQRVPHMVAVVAKAFINPADPDRSPFWWLVDEVVLEDSDELQLVDALERLPRWKHGAPRSDGDTYRSLILPGDSLDAPPHCAVVMDASGFWQDGAHARARTSEKWLRSRRWEWLFYPQPPVDGVDVLKNPDIVERCRAANARLKAANGTRRMFSLPHLTHTNRAMRSWENRNGAPYRRSPFAHVCDAVTYPVYRFFGKPKAKAAPDVTPVQRVHGDRRRGFDGVF
jgi:hypothetical protein